MPNNYRRYVICLLCLTTLLLSGCSGRKHMREVEHYVSQLKQTSQLPQKASLLKNLEPPTPVTFTASNRRSPFSPIDSASTGSGHVTSKHPLQNYQVEQLRFKGTVTQGDNTWAFILAPDNKLYQVKLGDMIGNHYGKIISISPTSLILREPVDQQLPADTNSKIVTLQLKGSS